MRKERQDWIDSISRKWDRHWERHGKHWKAGDLYISHENELHAMTNKQLNRFEQRIDGYKKRTHG